MPKEDNIELWVRHKAIWFKETSKPCWLTGRDSFCAA